MDPAVAKALAIGAVVPGVASLLVLLAFWIGRRGAADAASFDGSGRVALQLGERPWIAPAAFGLIIALCFPVLFNVHNAVPASSFEWMPWIAAGAMVLGVLAPGGAGGGVPLHGALRWLLRAALVLGAGYVSSRTLIKGWGVPNAVMWLGGLVASTLVAFWGIERVQNRVRGWSGAAILMIWAGAASQVLIASLDSLKQGQVAVAASAVCGAAMAVAILRPRFTLAFGGTHVPVVITAAALFQAVIFKDEVPKAWWAELALLLLAAVLPNVVRSGPRGERGLSREIARVALTAVPAIAAVGIAVATMAKVTAQ